MGDRLGIHGVVDILVLLGDCLQSCRKLTKAGSPSSNVLPQNEVEGTEMKSLRLDTEEGSPSSGSCSMTVSIFSQDWGKIFWALCGPTASMIMLTWNNRFQAMSGVSGPILVVLQYQANP